MSKDDSIEILTVYTPTEALYYLADEWMLDPDKATVIKRIKYDKPPVVKFNKEAVEDTKKKEAKP